MSRVLPILKGFVVKRRLVAAVIALALAPPAIGLADDTPWAAIKNMLREPANEIKQRFERYRPPTPQKAKPGTQEAAPVPVPILVPRPRPDTALSFAPAAPEPPPPPGNSATAIAILPPPVSTLPPPAYTSACAAALAKLSIEADRLAPVREGACGIAEPVSISALGGGATDLTVKAITECMLAERLAKWLRDKVQPEARSRLGGAVTGLRIAASYTCRTRNGVEGAKLSEHGLGKAIDISAFRIDGRGWIEVGGAHGRAEAQFLSTIRSAACGPFTTVLGPGSDAHHSDHFHFDLAARNKGGRSRGLYCK